MNLPETRDLFAGESGCHAPAVSGTFPGGMSKRVMIAWSSGKDSAWMLHTLQRDPEIEIAGLFTTVNKTHQRVAMHAVRLELLQLQADAIGLPLTVIEIPSPCSNEAYEEAMRRFVSQAQEADIEAFAFGDLFLEDIRDYRISRLQGTGIEPLFPIWGIPTGQLAKDVIAAGTEAVLTCVDPRQLAPDFAGRRYDAALLAELPATVDPCGENGEFHSFVFAGPMFQRPLAVEVGEIVERDGFVFADVTAKR